jgi:hypothetical protein
MQIPTVTAIDNLHVKQYHFLDDLSFIQPPETVFTESSHRDIQKFVRAISKRFEKAGWEGDGKIGIIWIPPFVDCGIEDTWGTYVWHVKQDNNGTSWLASEVPLNFSRLHQQNTWEQWGTHFPCGIMFSARVHFQRRIQRLVTSLRRQLRALPKSGRETITEIREVLAQSTQGDLIAELNYFLDDCYLEVLQEVFDLGNPSHLLLGRFRSNLNPMKYIPQDEADERTQEVDAEAGQWFTIKGLISDIWRSYRFEAFKDKTEMLFKACEYKMEPAVQHMVAKHVQLRNCVQHHEGHVTSDALRQAGVKQFSMLADNGKETILAQHIAFTLPELAELGKQLTALAISFDEHTQKRIRSVHWVPKSFLRGIIKR